MGMRPSLRRSFLCGGVGLTGTAAATALARAQSSAADFAVFVEFSPQNKKMLPGWNRRVFTDTDSRKGDSIRCDFATGVVTLAAGYYHISGLSSVGYDSSKEPPEMTATRSPAAAGYCRVRRVNGDPGPEQLDLHAVDNADPSIVCIGSMSSANLVPSLFETFLEASQATRIVVEHQTGSKPQDILLRVFVGNSRWHAFARLAVRRLQ
jgi:hypothetical protein